MTKDDNDEESSSEVGQPLATATKWPKFFAISHCELLWRSTCLLMFISGLSMMAAASTRELSDRHCAAELSVWSPLIDAVEYEEHDWASIFATKHSGFTGAPTKEMEARWKAIVEDIPSPDFFRDAYIGRGLAPCLTTVLG